MKIEYDEAEDTLFLSLQDAPVVSNVSQSWNVNVGYAERGVAQVTILGASTVGVWPVKRVGPRPRGKGRDWREWEIYVGLLTAVILAFVVMAVPLWPSEKEAEVSLTPRACALLERAGARIEPIGDEQACTVRVEYSGRASSTSLLRFEHEGREVDVRINAAEVLSVRYL